MEIAGKPVKCKVIAEEQPHTITLAPGMPPVQFRVRFGLLEDLHWLVRKPPMPFKKIKDWDGSIVTVPDEHDPRHRVRLLQYEAMQAAYILYVGMREDPDVAFKATAEAHGLTVPPNRQQVPTEETYGKGKEWLTALLAEFEEAGLNSDYLRAATKPLRESLSLDADALARARKNSGAGTAGPGNSSSPPAATSTPAAPTGVPGGS